MKAKNKSRYQFYKRMAPERVKRAKREQQRESYKRRMENMTAEERSAYYKEKYRKHANPRTRNLGRKNDDAEYRETAVAFVQGGFEGQQAQHGHGGPPARFQQVGDQLADDPPVDGGVTVVFEVSV